MSSWSRSTTQLGLFHQQRSSTNFAINQPKRINLSIIAKSVNAKHSENHAVLDLTDHKLNNLDILNSEKHNDSCLILLACHNCLTGINYIDLCRNLIKLDLSYNRLSVLPGINIWKCLPRLETLLLHHNLLDSIYDIKNLSILNNLSILTLYGNAVEHHPIYRHLLVNILSNIKLLDFYIVSDEELIENAKFGSKCGCYSRNLEHFLVQDNININNVPLLSANEQHQFHLNKALIQLKDVKLQHRKYSPVLIIQSVWRGYVVRRQQKRFAQAALQIQRFWRKFLTEKYSKQAKTSPNSSINVFTLFVVCSSELAVSLFTQLKQKIEQAEEVQANLFIENHYRIIRNDIKNRNPIVRKFPQNRGLKQEVLILPGRLVSAKILHSLSVIPAHKLSGCKFSNKSKQFLQKYLNQYENPYTKLLQLQCPNTRFLELLRKAIEKYNNSASRAAPSTASNNNLPSILMYSGTQIQQISAAVSIQSTWRSYRMRKYLQPNIGAELLKLRSAVVIQRFLRSSSSSFRLRVLRGCLHYALSINNNRLLLRSEVLEALRLGSVGQFAALKSWPEHRANFTVMPLNKAELDEINQLSQNHLSTSNLHAHTVYGREVVVISNQSEPRFWPIPRWLSTAIHCKPLQVVQMKKDSTVGSTTQKVDLNRRLYRLLIEGCDLALMPDINKGLPELSDQSNSNDLCNPLIPQPNPLTHPNEGYAWPKYSFVQFTYNSVEEARIRALTLLINTIQPNFNLKNHTTALLMTPQHLQIAINAKSALDQAQIINRSMEEQQDVEWRILVGLFFPRLSQVGKISIAASGLFSHQQFLAIQSNLKQFNATEEQIIQPTSLQLESSSSAHMFNISASLRSEHFELHGIPKPMSYSVNGDFYQLLLQQQAQLNKLESSRELSQHKVRQSEQRALLAQAVRAQINLHKVRMVEMESKREVDLSIRKFEWQSEEKEAKLSQQTQIQAKSLAIQSYKNEAARRSQIAKLDQQTEQHNIQELARRDKQNIGNCLFVREVRLNQLNEERKESIALKKAQHDRILNAKNAAMSFITQQNSISKQLQSGLINKIKQTQQVHTIAQVRQHKSIEKQRKEAVAVIMKQNLNRKKLSAASSSIHMKELLDLRRFQDSQYAQLLRNNRLNQKQYRLIPAQTAATSIKSGSHGQSSIPTVFPGIQGVQSKVESVWPSTSPDSSTLQSQLSVLKNLAQSIKQQQ
jgi:hypothetical protein